MYTYICITGRHYSVVPLIMTKKSEAGQTACMQSDMWQLNARCRHGPWHWRASYTITWPIQESILPQIAIELELAMAHDGSDPDGCRRLLFSALITFWPPYTSVVYMSTNHKINVRQQSPAAWGVAGSGCPYRDRVSVGRTMFRSTLVPNVTTHRRVEGDRSCTGTDTSRRGEHSRPSSYFSTSAENSDAEDMEAEKRSSEYVQETSWGIFRVWQAGPCGRGW